ncbi:MAG: multiheme c-type cytochrome [bacterium]
MKYKYSFIILSFLLFAFLSLSAYARTTKTPLFMPGTQPMEVINITGSTECRGCHGGYDRSVEVTFNWEGMMMAQASKDPLMYAALDIANQDIPDADDLCLRCHAPNGWLLGNANPTDGSKFTPKELDGIQCDFCHRMVNPLSEEGKALVEPDNEYQAEGLYPA